MDLLLKDKVILVTGGASGIGAAIVAGLIEEGAIPCTLDRNAGNGFSLTVELTDGAACAAAVASVLERFGRIDGLVNNAGTNDGVGLEDGSYEGFLRSLEINAGHYWQMAQAARSALAASRGTIINIISKVALTGQGHTSGYAAANGIRMDLTTEWAEEYAADGIRVNGVVVAECWTPQYERWVNGLSDGEQRLDRIKQSVPLDNRLTQPREVADTVLFLLSPCSQGINKELVAVDGGYIYLDRQATGSGG